MEQDDSMLSTPSSHANDETLDEENLFPSQTVNATTTDATSYVEAETPQNDHLNAAAPGELSPPRSQPSTAAHANGFGQPIDADEAEMTDDEAIDVKGDRARIAQDEKNKPGYGWKNKKAQEDMQRSWDYIVDKDFDIKQFGDPLA